MRRRSRKTHHKNLYENVLKSTNTYFTCFKRFAFEAQSLPGRPDTSQRSLTWPNCVKSILTQPLFTKPSPVHGFMVIAPIRHLRWWKLAPHNHFYTKALSRNRPTIKLLREFSALYSHVCSCSYKSAISIWLCQTCTLSGRKHAEIKWFKMCQINIQKKRSLEIGSSLSGTAEMQK